MAKKNLANKKKIKKKKMNASSGRNVDNTDASFRKVMRHRPQNAAQNKPWGYILYIWDEY